MTVQNPLSTTGAGDATLQAPPGEQRARRIEGRSPTRLAWERLRRDRVAMASLVVVALLFLMALLAPVAAAVTGHPYDVPYRQTGLSPEGLPVPPNGEFWLGTDRLGRDQFVRVVYGARVSLTVGVLASMAAIVIGLVVGILAGFYGGRIDTVLSRFTDVVLSFPYLVIAIALVAVYGASIKITTAVITFFTWPTVARIVRGQVLSIREKEYVEAARSLGASNLRIMVSDVLPNLIGPVLVYGSLLIPAAIIFEATLSFLGLGIVPPTPSWGGMLQESLNLYALAWWTLLFPGLALFVTTLAFNLLGDGLRDAFDPGSDRVMAC